MSVPTRAGNYPAGVSDNDPYFDMPSVGDDTEELYRRLKEIDTEIEALFREKRSLFDQIDAMESQERL